LSDKGIIFFDLSSYSSSQLRTSKFIIFRRYTGFESRSKWWSSNRNLLSIFIFV